MYMNTLIYIKEAGCSTNYPSDLLLIFIQGLFSNRLSFANGKTHIFCLFNLTTLLYLHKKLFILRRSIWSENGHETPASSIGSMLF